MAQDKRRPEITELQKTLLAKRLRGAASAGPPAGSEIPRTPLSDRVPPTASQKGLWALDKIVPNSPQYNIPYRVALKGELDVEALQRALDSIIARHESLRTTLRAEGGRPYQHVHSEQVLAMQRIDLTQLPAERLTEKAAARLAHEEACKPFDLEQGPLLRASLLHHASNRHDLLLTFHHAVFDGWSENLFFNELALLYRQHREGGRADLPALPIRFADFAAWQQTWLSSDAAVRQATYWKERLAGAPLLMDLPVDHARPTMRQTSGAYESVPIDIDVSRSIESLAKREGVSVFVVLLAGLNVLLSRYARSTDIVVGSAVAGRDRTGVENLIGYFVDMLALRTSLEGELTFRELLARMRDTVAGALRNADLPFNCVLDALQLAPSIQYHPLFQVSFQYQPEALSRLHSAGLEFALEKVHNGCAKFDLTFEAIKSVDGTVLGIEYSTALFEGETVRRMLGHFTHLLQELTSNPDTNVHDAALLSAAERTTLLPPRVRKKLEVTGSLQQRFEAMAARTPTATALTYGAQTLTYDELNRRANRVAHALLSRGVKPGELIGLRVNRSIEMVVGILGTLKAGGAYLPLDPVYPRERMMFMLEDAQIRVVLTEAELAGELENTCIASMLIEAPQSSDENNPPDASTPDTLAYAIYTSGSTGKPKGVLITHANVLRLLDSTDHWFGFDATDVWTFFHSYAFDFSVWELWGALLYGGRVVVVPYEVSRSPQAFLELLTRERVTVLNQTPSAFRQLIQADREQAPSKYALRYVIFGGEALELQSLRPWFERYGDRRPQLINMYGITETTVHVTYRPITMVDVEAGRGSVIGVPIPDLQVHVLDARQQLVPLGVPGEMYVGGAGLALGYLRREELTAQRFIRDPFGGPGDRLYRTGDLAKRMSDGELEYLGRIDQQVKIRGFRIELGEIEVLLCQQSGVREAKVVARDYGLGDKRLVAYLAMAAEDGATRRLRDALRSALPEYMIPAQFVVLDKLPLTPNGKVDHKALPDPAIALQPDEGYIEPHGATEIALASIWRDVLGLERVGAESRFFEIGGNSLLSVQVVSRCRDAGMQLSVQDFFKHPTIRALANFMTAAPEATTAAAETVKDRAQKQREAMLRRRQPGGR